MKIFRLLSICLLLLAMMQGCLKDKGNYTYHDINKVALAGSLPDTFRVNVQDSLRIDIQLSQTIPNNEGLEIDWVFYKESLSTYRRQLGHSTSLRALITDAPSTYSLDLFVKDKKTNVSMYKRFVVEVTTPFNQGWLVLEESGGHNDVSMILPNNTVSRNIYSKANNNQFLTPGQGRIAVYSRRADQLIYVFTPHSGKMLSVANFTTTLPFSKWFFIPPSAEEPQEVFSNSTEEHLLNNGKAYGIYLITPPPYAFGVATPGDYYLAPYQLSSQRGFIFYDTVAQRFWYRPSSDFSLVNINSSGPTDIWNLNKVDKRLLYAGMGSGETFNAVFESKNRDSAFVLTGTSAGTLSKASSADTLAAGLPLQSASNYLSSRLVQHIYFAKDNQLYLWDIPAKTHRLLYTFPAGTKVKRMKWHYNQKSGSDPDNYRVMAVATDEGGEGKVYLFGTEATGNFVDNTYRSVFSGFGKISDITYKTQP
ncbi:hypothetical protein HHL16_12750 [Pseudoflavitalea sp. G-6-1-2]|uniref:PKD-like family lipoprotein n=1 Tax=Pseudoflavitalea sp. G-6-1-2 TaxID=2728841 RepID=UPI00146D1C71|nr:PKD-like family lipoprotein [Pseudoflavitalea sp. G-6-1-2]NML21752.1 hypothetical protein [Pseudoflavitalea sp. G-6-1-2]